MKKLVIPAILIGTIMIAAGFAIQPVQQAGAVHTTVQANTSKYYTLTGIVGPDADAGVLEAARWAINQPFQVISVTALQTADTGADCDLAASNIRTDLVPEAGVAELNPAASDANTDTRVLLSNAVADTLVAGATTLEVGSVEGANCDADARETITAIIETTGALTAAPAATISAVSGAKANNLAGD